uniref:Uncharacterized protein n=1 Tax=Vitis vinifera TaxID=29760 RepID=F6GT33_VITVI
MNSTTTLTLSISLLYNVALEFIQDRLHFFVGIADGHLNSFLNHTFILLKMISEHCPSLIL